MTDTTTNTSLAIAGELTEIALGTRDCWRALATYLMRTCAAPQEPSIIAKAYELLQDAVVADDDLAGLLAYPEHYQAERERIASVVGSGDNGLLG